MVPILIATTAVVGYWSFILAKEAAQENELKSLQIISEQVVSNVINRRVQLLKQSGLDGVESFDKAYQQEVFEELGRLQNSIEKSFLIVSRSSKAVLFSSANDQQSDTLLNIHLSVHADTQAGTYSANGKQRLFVAQYNQYWDWQVYVTESVDVIAEPVNRIRVFTTIVAVLATLISALLLWWIANKMIIRKVVLLKSTAEKISLQEKHMPNVIKSDDELGELSAVMFDMSEKIQRNIDQAQQANKAKSEFLATMSHEIRTPLNGLVGSAKLLENTPLDKHQQQFVSAIITSSEALAGVINDVLDLSKIESGKLVLEATRIDLQAFLENIKLVFTSSANINKTELVCTSSLPSGYAVFSDETRLRQIVFNLVGNAIKFTSGGKVSVDFTLRLTNNLNDKHTHAAPAITSSATGNTTIVGEQRGELTITVADTGIGILPQRIPYIFDSFTQSDTSTTREYGGSGLGLSIVKKMLTLLGGEVSVTSEVDQGSCFTVALPLQCVASNTIVSPGNEVITQANIETKSMKVLLVEDNEINTMVAKSILEQNNFTVFTTVNGKLAVEVVAKRKFDVVLMDIHMPEMDGVEATKAIRLLSNEHKNVPIIGLTAEAFEQSHNTFIKAGMYSVVTKPINERVLISHIHEAISKA